MGNVRGCIQPAGIYIAALAQQLKLMDAIELCYTSTVVVRKQHRAHVDSHADMNLKATISAASMNADRNSPQSALLVLFRLLTSQTPILGIPSSLLDAPYSTANLSHCHVRVVSECTPAPEGRGQDQSRSCT